MEDSKINDHYIVIKDPDFIAYIESKFPKIKYATNYFFWYNMTEWGIKIKCLPETKGQHFWQCSWKADTNNNKLYPETKEESEIGNIVEGIDYEYVELRFKAYSKNKMKVSQFGI